MSSSVQAIIRLAPDPRLPRRDELFDDALVGGRLNELLERTRTDRPITECTRIRAKYRPGESLRTTYRLVDDMGDRLVSARMFPVDKADRFVRSQDAALNATPGTVLFDESTGTVFWMFPQDRKLRGLAQLTCPPAALREVFGRPWTHSELMAYMPEKAATARCADDSGEAVGFAKVQVGAQGRQSVATLLAARRGLPENGVLRLPYPVDYLPELHMALYSPVPGRPLHQLNRAAVPDAMAALGAALSVLHRQPVDGFGPFTRLTPDSVVRAGDLVQVARPDLKDLTQALVAELLRTARPLGPTVLLHGDLHPKNVLVHDTGVSLVDLDQASAGPAAAELGGALARLWCPRPGDEIDPGTAEAAAEALLGSYDRRPGHDELIWYAAAALLVERAVRAISRVDVVALADLDQVLATALRWAGRRREDQR